MSNIVTVPSKTPMSDDLLEKMASRFKALAEPSRLKVLRALMEGEANVSVIMDKTGLHQANASRHLNHLYREGILTRIKSKTNVIYKVKDPMVYELCKIACANEGLIE